MTDKFNNTDCNNKNYKKIFDKYFVNEYTNICDYPLNILQYMYKSCMT